MKTTAIILLILAALVLLSLITLSMISRTGNAPGLSAGRLSKCPDRPNCICSEYPGDTTHYIMPIVIPEHATNTEDIIKAAIEDSGGEIKLQHRHYMAATFSSALFGFVDDLEIRVDTVKNVIHIRSSSRVGYSDAGINRKRLDTLKNILEKRLGKKS